MEKHHIAWAVAALIGGGAALLCCFGLFAPNNVIRFTDDRDRVLHVGCIGLLVATVIFVASLFVKK